MIIVPHLLGGLGNQLFQISAAYALAKDNGMEYAVDFSGAYRTNNPPPNQHITEYPNTIFKDVPRCLPMAMEVLQEQFIETYNPIHVPDKSKCYLLKGFFQSEKYFAKYKEELLQLFKLPAIVKPFTSKVLGMHIRLSDYMGTDFKVCSMEWYKEALQEYGKEHHVVICTDSPHIVEHYFKGYDVVSSRDEVYDLAILANCDRLILSNSTFSWWGAYLGKPKDVMVVPDKWHQKLNMVDVYRKEFTRKAVQ